MDCVEIETKSIESVLCERERERLGSGVNSVGIVCVSDFPFGEFEKAHALNA